MTTTTSAWGNVLRGVAIGDAWGDPNEFTSIEMLTRNDRRGPELPERLYVTDDTQMTLYLAQAISASRGGTVAEVQDAIAREFLDYLADPDFGSRAPGVTVTGSLRRLKSGLPWTEATDDYSDGCGTVMRVTPAAFADQRRGIAAFSAAITHGTAVGVASAILTAELVALALSGLAEPGGMTHAALTLCWEAAERGLLGVGDWLGGLNLDLAMGFDVISRQLVHTRDALLAGYDRDPWATDPCVYGGQGWRSHECLATALLAVDAFPDDPWEALRRAVTTNGDSDSIGAVAGGLLGALHGEFWPEGTLDRLEPRYRTWIAEAAHYPLS